MSAVLLEPGDDFPPPDTVAQLRIPPHSIEAESAVLSGLLLDGAAWDRVGDLLAAADFYRYEHRIVFDAISVMANANRTADILTVYAQLQRLGKADEVGGLAYLNSLAQYVPSASNIRRYAEIVRERAVLRSLITASDQTATEAFNTQGKPIEQVLDEAENRIFSIGQSRASTGPEWQDPNTAMTEFIEAIQKRADGDQDFVPTRIEVLDEKLDGGMRPGEVIVIAARPGMGKTALALSICENVAAQHHSTAVFSLEMTLAQLNRRRVAMASHVPLHKIKRPQRMSDYEWTAMTAGVDQVRARPLYVSEMQGPTINQVRTRARNIKRRHGLRVLAIDYIGLMEGTDRRADRRLQLGEVSRGVKALAKELGISILLLAQLNRDVEKRPNMRPQLSDLRECGDIEQDADAVLFVHRPFHVKPDLGDEWKDYGEISIGKQRDGENGVLPVMYVGEAVTFKDWPISREIPRSQALTPRGVSRGMET